MTDRRTNSCYYLLHLKELIDQRGDDTAAEEARIDDGYMDLTAADLKDKVFEPVVKDILDLIRTFLAQVGDRCMAMFLIGQFGASEYVSRRVREELKSQIGLISYPQRWELAISRGAVYAGLDSYMRLLERHVVEVVAIVVVVVSIYRFLPSSCCFRRDSVWSL